MRRGNLSGTIGAAFSSVVAGAVTKARLDKIAALLPCEEGSPAKLPHWFDLLSSGFSCIGDSQCRITRTVVAGLYVTGYGHTPLVGGDTDVSF